VTPEPVTREAPPLRGRVVSTQSWRDVTFLHWAVDPDRVAPLLPPGTRPDLHEGRTYVGLVPFRMVGVGIGRGPRIPYFGSFLETNVRVYSVDDTGRRGVVFLTLDTDRAIVVPAVRVTVGAPYRWARMRFRRAGNRVTYEASLRKTGDRPSSRVVVRLGHLREATPLDDFLTSRWGAHVRHRGRTTYVPNRHEQWPLQDASVLELDDGLVASVGLPGVTDRPPDHVAFSEGVHAAFGPPYDATQPR
jgi:uncharacterized protein YqjF (DUF2071 family)